MANSMGVAAPSRRRSSFAGGTSTVQTAGSNTQPKRLGNHGVAIADIDKLRRHVQHGRTEKGTIASAALASLKQAAKSAGQTLLEFSTGSLFAGFGGYVVGKIVPTAITTVATTYHIGFGAKLLTMLQGYTGLEKAVLAGYHEYNGTLTDAEKRETLDKIVLQMAQGVEGDQALINLMAGITLPDDVDLSLESESLQKGREAREMIEDEIAQAQGTAPQTAPAVSRSVVQGRLPPLPTQ